MTTPSIPRTDSTRQFIPLFGEVQGAVQRSFSKIYGGPRVVALWAGVLVCAAAGTLCALLLAGFRPGGTWGIAALALVAAVAERGRVRLSATLEASISLVPTVVAAVLFGPVAAFIVGLASFVGDFKRPYMRWVVISSSRALTGAITGFVIVETSHLLSSRPAAIAVSTAIGAFLSESLDVCFTAVTFRLRGNGHMRTVFRTLAPLAFAAVPLYSPVVALLAFAYEQLSPWTLLLFFIPALAAHRVFGMYQEQRQLAADLASANARLERANLSFASALVATLDARDRYTAGHSEAVAIYARDIARRLGLSEHEQKLSYLCGLVHDIGKIGLAPGLLEKPGALTLDERRQMQEHSVIGERILAKVDDYVEIAAIVRHHHERWDGEGYPDKISGEDIPLLSRIIAAADAYNAMTSDRPYRDAMPSRVARMRLAQAVESQFDTTVVAAFEAVLAGADEAYRNGTRADFVLEEADFLAEIELTASRAA